eukprot:TRINITY_DN1894_c0_g1_i1.p1 TRINITY_DN1894_c0_g1~~TRINITY_DN1894_c0_g1_i1.p1  ORF type:complete len:263 (-),score=15.16 TRINITY_DN1894_c0_g1_i1:147-935(-)
MQLIRALHVLWCLSVAMWLGGCMSSRIPNSSSTTTENQTTRPPFSTPTSTTKKQTTRPPFSTPISTTDTQTTRPTFPTPTSTVSISTTSTGFSHTIRQDVLAICPKVTEICRYDFTCEIAWEAMVKIKTCAEGQECIDRARGASASPLSLELEMLQTCFYQRCPKVTTVVTTPTRTTSPFPPKTITIQDLRRECPMLVEACFLFRFQVWDCLSEITTCVDAQRCFSDPIAVHDAVRLRGCPRLKDCLDKMCTDSDSSVSLTV